MVSRREVSKLRIFIPFKWDKWKRGKSKKIDVHSESPTFFHPSVSTEAQTLALSLYLSSASSPLLASNRVLCSMATLEGEKNLKDHMIPTWEFAVKKKRENRSAGKPWLTKRRQKHKLQERRHGKGSGGERPSVSRGTMEAWISLCCLNMG